MAHAPKLKVFRLPVGFHDAYVAAPSQKAAAEAWGSGTDVFARGEAEFVTDPDLMAEPLARPGEVIKRLRGTAAEHIAALPVSEPKHRRRVRQNKPAPAKLRPRPSREELDAAEAALDAADKRQEAALKEIAAREARLEQEKQALAERHATERAKLRRLRDHAAHDYDLALEAWRQA
jgi:hypothetical protein